MLLLHLVFIVVSLSYALLEAFHLEFGFIVSDNLGTAAHDVTLPMGSLDLPVDAIPGMSRDKTEGIVTNTTVPSAIILPFPPPLAGPSQEGPSVTSNQLVDVGAISSIEVIEAETPSVYHVTPITKESASPLLYAPLYNTAMSRMKLSSSPGRPGSVAPFAMSMLTPTEPPSPFPGFPSLSSFETSRTKAAVAVAEFTGAEPTTVETSSPPLAQSNDTNSSSWGSSSFGVGSQGHVPVLHRPVDAGHMDGFCTRLAGATPWPPSHPLQTPISSSYASRGDTAIFDLDRFDDEGQEVISASLPVKGLPAGSTANKHGDATASQGPQRQHVKLRFPSRKASASHKDVPCDQDVHRPGVFSSSNSAWTKNISAPPGGDDTPVWPPLLPEGPAPFFCQEDIGDAAISSEATSVMRSLRNETPARAAHPWSSASGGRLLPSVDGTGQRQFHQEPGREYAAVAAAASIMLSNFKVYAKKVVMAACAGDETTLRTAQDDLHAVSMQLLNLELAPHSYTTSIGACRALAYSTPLIGMQLNDMHSSADVRASASIGSSGGGDWTSMGSRTAVNRSSGFIPEHSPCQSCSTEASEAGYPPSPLASVLTTTPALRTGSGASDGAWDDGPRVLPADVDSYLAALRGRDISSSACVLANFQSSLSFTGLLINSACRQLYLAQEETAKWRTRAKTLRVQGSAQIVSAAEALLNPEDAVAPGVSPVCDNPCKDITSTSVGTHASPDCTDIKCGLLNHVRTASPTTPLESCCTASSSGSGGGSCEGPQSTKSDGSEGPEGSSIAPRRLWRPQE
ncbi:hypothetical protein VOLCADRAFT_90478 [Volvox carteri f. nagariensis]|uniref:Pherophorin domain-containing protein n=1 Tax=Volvox carteri f. nagariensis TaxID=3068 RepID=D8TUH5_VOLCA|nr:uncharacterized protein VOLCADRAFT_90478 [Volvox carteri f. nagariensis]EFJ48708.1 hypothetical protein VOLCADRAFT_90478 [Volvox carteri f. nagariensis]|eukprot:XP_002950040.1 hypothetical protein VOLCADRAFT_90478 [Volvox carteri f. nagariensis]